MYIEYHFITNLYRRQELYSESHLYGDLKLALIYSYFNLLNKFFNQKRS